MFPRRSVVNRCVVPFTRALPVLAVLIGFVPHARAQQSQEIVGDYAGTIGDQDATLHLIKNPDGSLRATLDHLDPAAPWMFTCADVKVDGKNLRFTIPTINANWIGTLSDDGKTLLGTWSQKGALLLVSFVRQQFIPAAKPSPVDGIWLGTMPITAETSTRIQLVFKSDVNGREFCTMDAIDIYYPDLQCAHVAFQGRDLSFDIPVAGEHWSGKLSEDGSSLSLAMSAKVISGKTTQEISVPANLARQSDLTPLKAPPASTYDAAMPPVSAADLQTVLDRDLAAALKSGELAPSTGQGVSIGVYEHGTTRIFSFGAAKPDSIFEIGSLTKTFTGLILAQLSTQNRVRLDEPVRELLPPGTVAKPQGPEVTLIDLATQRSGLPPMPDNIDLGDLDQPYAAYHAADLLAYISKHGVANPTRASSQFGSLGFGLLGVALATRAGLSYGHLLRDEVASPLGLKDTTTELTPEQQLRFIPGHDEFHGPAKPWNSDALAGAIAIRSNAGDMLTYLTASLHPERVVIAAPSAEAKTIAAALRLSLQPQSDTASGMKIALGWLYQNETGNYWHNGATAAYSCYAFFNPKGDYAAVVLFNGSPGVNGSFVEVLGRHISQRLAGKPAISLAP
jgi:D-alanyl-D-alanine-carboxypeptidase/D-alanyl-D-alanine-endopeptidase